MANPSENIAILKDTLHKFEIPFHFSGVPGKLTTQQRRQAHVYLPKDLNLVLQEYTPKGKPYEVCYCVNSDSFAEAMQLVDFGNQHGGRKMRTLVLNLANPLTPGGSVYQGANAQEEALCRVSSLLLSLESPDAAPFYQYHRHLKNTLSSDALILSPRVEIIKDATGNMLDESYVVSVVSCSAPMLRQGYGELTQNQYLDLMYKRILGILTCAAFWGFENLVLGAFGCGVFGNDAAVVAPLFKKALNACGGNFHTVAFAVLDRSASQYNFKQFKNIFPN